MFVNGLGAPVELLVFSCPELPPSWKPINPSSSPASLLLRRILKNTNAIPPRRAAPPIPTQTPTIVFRVLLDMPDDPLLLPPLSEAAYVAVDVDVLLEVIVEEMVLPSVVMTVTWVVTRTLSLREVETSVLEVVVSFVFVDVLEESDVGVEDVLDCLDVKLGEEVEEGVEDVGVFEDDEESLVGVADVLEGVDELAAALLGELDEVDPPVTPDATPERAESTTPCRLLKTLCSIQLACVMASSTANIDSRRIWGRENIMTAVCVLMKEEDGNRGGDDEEMGSLFAPSYSTDVCLLVAVAETQCF